MRHAAFAILAIFHSISIHRLPGPWFLWVGIIAAVFALLIVQPWWDPAWWLWVLMAIGALFYLLLGLLGEMFIVEVV